MKINPSLKSLLVFAFGIYLVFSVYILTPSDSTILETLSWAFLSITSLLWFISTGYPLEEESK